MSDPGAFPRRALLVEDDPITRALMAALLTVARFEVRSCATSREAIEAFGQFDPDVLVADIELGDQPNGAQLASLLGSTTPGLAIVVVSHYPSPRSAGSLHAIPDRAAFVSKDTVEHASVLLDAVESALDDARDAVVRTAEPDNALAQCTPVQLEVMRLIALGCSNDEIARRRGVSQRAAERSVQRVYEALELGSHATNPRVEATRIYARAFGLPGDA